MGITPMARKSGQEDETSGERIAKAMARAGLCSRREAEAWIEAGRVAVNGTVITSPALNVAPGDRITVDGQPLPQRERTRLFLYHKPRGLVTTHADPERRPTIFAALPQGLPRLVSVGRLDMNTEGLILLTNDGGLARALELPATGWLRRYRVRAHGRVRQDALDRLRAGIAIDGIRYGPIEARLEREQGANLWLGFAMREGKNREVKNVLGHLGLKVNRLIRVSFGPFQLGDLPEGAIEEVKTRTLREQLGERVAALAGADFSAPIIERVAPPTQAPPARPEARTPDLGFTRDQALTKREPAQAALPVRAAQDDGTKAGARRPRNDDRSDRKGRNTRRASAEAERLGEPELARRERRRGRRVQRGKERGR